MSQARLPLIAKTVALVVFLGVGTVVGIQLVKRMNAVPPSITAKPKLKDAKLVSTFENFKYDYQEGQTHYRLTAAKDTVFSDSRHELEQVKLELFDKDGEISGQVTSELCKYDQAKATIRFEKNVIVNTRDGLEVKTESLDYNQTTGNAETLDKVEFTRDKISGNCIGVFLESEPKRLEMKEAVYVKILPSQENKTNNPQSVSKPIEITGDWGEYTSDEQVITLKGKAQIAEPERFLRADTLIAYLTDDKKIQYVEALGGGHLEKQGADSLKLEATKMDFIFDGAGKLSEAQARGDSRLESKGKESSLKVKATDMDFTFDGAGKLSQAETRGESRLENQGKASPLQVDSENMNFYFNELGLLVRAEAQENVIATTTGEGPKRTLTANELTVFTIPTATSSEVERIKAKGNVNLLMEAPEPTATLPNPSIKQLKASEAEVFYYPGGQFLRQAQAHGNTNLTITPIKEIPGAEKRLMTAEHTTLTFFETGNAVHELNAQGKVKLQIETISKTNDKPVQTSESERAKAIFDRTTGEMLEALQEGDFRYNEGSRNAVASKAKYNATNKLIELREGKVMVWDEQARTQADEIDLFTEKQESFARGKVRSTYYSPETTGKSTPFRNTKSPVFITSKDLHVFNSRGEAIYTGDARAWQDDNFIRSEKLELFRDERKMVATGNVSSALYQAKKGLPEGSEGKEGKNNQAVVPIFATSDSMDYSDKNRLAEYKGKVKMKQGNELLEANQVKIFLETEVNEMKRLEAFEKVVLTQPGRRGEGDEALYNAYDQKTILSGNMAKVVSDLQGTITGRRLTLLGGDDRILVDDQRGLRRVKSTHEVQR